MEDSRFAASLGESLLCRECRIAPPEFERAVSYGLYEDELRSFIHLLKFERLPKVAGLLAGPLVEAILQLEGVTAREVLVVAVPLFAARERQRGYNQSVLLAAAALGRLKKVRPGWRLRAAHSILVRRRRTESQWVLAPRARRRNLEGAFAVPEALRAELKGREVLLVDDLLTSGATARECARVLKRGGAAKVWVATVARAQKHAAMLQPALEQQTAKWDLAGSMNPVR